MSDVLLIPLVTVGVAAGSAIVGWIVGRLVYKGEDADWMARQEVSRWARSGFVAGFIISLALAVQASWTTWLMFVPVGIVVDRVVWAAWVLASGHDPPVGWGCAFGMILPIVGGLLWLVGIWPFG